MDAESQKIYNCMTPHHAMLHHPSGPVARLVAEVGRRECWARKWLRRFEAVNEPRFEMYCSQARVPKTRLNQTTAGSQRCHL